MGQQFLSAYDAGDPDQQPREPESCPHDDTKLLSPSSPRLTPESSPWAGTRPLWCRGCSRVVDRVPVDEAGE